MTFLTELSRLREAATKGPWFKRYCDDDNHMCMTVISSTDHGKVNTGQFKDEPDTIAATFHQIAPVVGDTADCNEATTDLILHLVNHAEAIRDLVVAAKPLAHYSRMRDAKPMNGMDDAIHSIHVGTEWEAEVTQSQLRGLSEALAKLEEA